MNKSFLLCGKITVFVSLSFFWIPINTTATSFFQDHNRGWHWYESQEPEIRSQEPGEQTSLIGEKAKTPAEIVAKYRKELENRLAQAWLKPTPEKIQAYQEMQKDMLDRSQRFSSVWMQTVFQNPHLDHTLIAPVNQQARHIQLDQEKQKVQSTIHSLKEEFGLFFFVSGNCPYCHQFAPIVKAFSEKYGWKVLAISVDGGVVAEFPQAIPDDGLFESWGGQVLPSLYAVNPKTEQVIPLSFGLTAIDQIETRLMTLIKANQHG
jgi:conjugal transfer pilus assembly protein TraF